MANLSTDMPPLHSAETVIGVTTPASSQSTSIGGTAVSGAANNSIIDSTQSPETKNINNTISSTNSQTNSSNNTISAAADSSDNQPGTPQPHHPNLNDAQQNSSAAHHPYAAHHIYSNSQPSTTTAANSHLNQMYPQHVYSQSNMDLQQQQQQQQSSYPSYLNSYEQFYQQQQQQQQQNPSQPSSQTQNPQQMDYINSNTNSLYLVSDYKLQAPPLRYQPYLQTPTTGISSVNPQNSNTNNPLDGNSQTAPVVSSASSSLMSPRVVSSTSPSSSSNQMQISGSASSISSLSAGNPSSPNSASTPQCKKCGIMCTNESELQEHITNVHGASPYGSSGYASSPYIKDEMQQTPPSQSQQQQQPATQQTAGHSGNPGEILDLDSQKMLYPPTAGSMAAMIHQPLGTADPLHGLHSMQQRAGINTWDQQTQEGVPPYLQQPTESKNLPNHSPYYQSPKQSPYHVTNSTNVIKTEYQPIIKSEFTGDAQQYISDKSFDPTAPNQQQQQMMPPAISSSPAEFPSTTTGGPQDSGQQNAAVNQQFRGGNFEPPSSSSAALPSGPVSGKAANWKSNEARRPKTYNCTACNKWFTSSGHLKRHYNTTLHKNAVKSSGQPDPATLPISVHHHPSRDPTGKTGRRAAAAAANAANVATQQQQQQPNPVQPPEPPNSPQDYGGSQVAAGGLTPLAHYAATPSPNSMYQQQQQYPQHQYMPQAQSTSNSSPQHASSMVNHHLQQQQQQHQNQQQAVMNGHPNALAGPSVSPTRQQAPMPSSQMRGLLNSTMPTTRVHIVKSEHLEAAIMQEQMYPNGEVEELAYLKAVAVKQPSSEETLGRRIIYSPKANGLTQQKEGELLEDQGSEIVIQHLQEASAPTEVDHSVEHLHNSSQVPTPSQIQHYQLDQQQQLDMEQHFRNITLSSPHNNMHLHSPLIISHQQYQEQLQQQQLQMVGQGTYTLMRTPPPSPQQQQRLNIMAHQPYTNIPLATNTQQQLNNMLQQQQPLTTMERQPLPPATTIRTTNIVNMQPPSPHHMQPPQQQHMELQPLRNTQLQLDTINTNTPSHITTSSITNMPSYHQLQHPGSVLPPLDPMPNYPHTIIGNAEFLTVDAYGNLVSSSEQQLIQTADGQYLQFIPTGSAPVTGLYTTQPSDHYTTGNRTPQQGDLPPMTLQYHQEPIGAAMPSYSPPHSIPDFADFGNSFDEQRFNAKATRKTSSKRSKHPNSRIGPLNEVLPDGRIKCIPCRKIFSRMCYLTQHNTTFHDGKRHFRCDKCGKRFKRYLAFVIHYAKHKCTDKAHKCHLCPKQFHHKTDLRRHIDAIHTGNKKHSCHICQKSFCRRDHLLKHIETHSRPRAQGKRNKANAAKAINNSKDFTFQMPLNNPEGVLIMNPSTSPSVSAAAVSAPNSPTSTTNQDLYQNNFQNIQYSQYEQYVQPQYEIYEIVQQPTTTY